MTPTVVVAQPRYQLGDWLIDVDANLLVRGDERRSLRLKAMELLLLFLQHPDRTISREEIVMQIWHGNEAVAAQGINNAIWSIRQALDDDADAPRYLQTIPKKGYRLIASVSMVAPTAAQTPPVLASANHAASHDHAAMVSAATSIPSSNPASTPTPASIPLTTPTPAASRSRRWRLLAAATVSAALLVTVAMLARQTWAPAPTAFRSVTALTNYPGMEYLGQLSPDGELLAFGWWQGHGSGRLYLRSARDIAAKPIALPDVDQEVVSISWSPDGRQLAFAELASDGRCTVAIYSLQTAEVRRLALCVALWTQVLAWSPVAAQLVFTGKRGEQPPGLFLYDLEQKQERQLTAMESVMPDHQPAWSPDGSRIAFARWNNADASRDLYETDLSGRVTRLTEKKFRDLHGLTWRHDSDALIYATSQHGSRTLWQFDRLRGSHQPLGLEGSAPTSNKHGLVFSLIKKHQSIGRLSLPSASLPSAPASLQPIVRSVTSEQSPDYSAARQALVFVSARSGFRELWTSKPDGSDARALTSLRDTATRPRWSPDGNAIAFVGSCQPERYGLCLLHVETGKVLTLHVGAGDYGAPSWTDDGNELLVVMHQQGQQQLWAVARDGSQHRQLNTAAEPELLQRRPAEPVLYYQARNSQPLRQLDLDSGADELSPAGRHWPNAVVAWTLVPGGVLVLQREQQENWLLWTNERASWQPLASFPLGTFAEFPRVGPGPEPGVYYVELADTAFADLMLAR